MDKEKESMRFCCLLGHRLQAAGQNLEEDTCKNNSREGEEETMTPFWHTIIYEKQCIQLKNQNMVLESKLQPCTPANTQIHNNCLLLSTQLEPVWVIATTCAEAGARSGADQLHPKTPNLIPHPTIFMLYYLSKLKNCRCLHRSSPTPMLKQVH